MRKIISLALAVLLMVPYLSSSTNFAAASQNKNKESKAVFSQEKNLVDSTGEIFETEKNNKTVNDTSAIAASQDGIGLDKVENAGGVSLAEPEDQADAQGVIVTLKNDSLLEKKSKDARAGKSQNEIKSAIAGQLGQLRAQHQNVLNELPQILGTTLISNKNKAEKNKTRYAELYSASNSIVLLDVPVKPTIEKLKNNPEVVTVEPNRKVAASLTESVPMIGADQVWPIVAADGTMLDGSGMRVGIIDTGVDYTNPDLGGCFGTGCKVSGGYDFVNLDSDPMDDHGHGTHVAATAAGDGSYIDTSGVSHPLPGVAPRANIYAYKVLSSSGSGYSNAIIAAIERCSDPNGDNNFSDHLDVCSLSLGGPGNPDDSMSLAVDRATDNGTVFTIAAGNSGPSADTIGSPGTSRNAITVAAAIKTSQVTGDPIASFSSRGPVNWIDSNGVAQSLMKPDIAAPGVNICAAAWNNWRTSYCLDNSHISISGTSMATPHVAGAALLLREAHPELTPAEIKSFFKSSAKDLGDAETAQGAGLLNVSDALNQSGLPQNVARISGLPLHFSEIPTSSTFSTSKLITIKNTTTETQTYSPRFDNASQGLSVSLDQTSIALAPDGSAGLTVTVNVDNTVAKSPSQLSGTLHLQTSSLDVKASVSVEVGNRLVANPTTVYMGTDIASVTSWTASQTVSLNNLLLDTGTAYSATWDSAVPGITATLDKSSISLSPGGNGSITLNLSADNSKLSNQKYSSTLTLSSTNQTLNIPVFFYKGYLMGFNYGGNPPSRVSLYNGLNNYTFAPVNPNSDTLVIFSPGPYDASGFWLGNYAPTASYQVIRTNISTDIVSNVSMNRNDASHTITLKAPTVDGRDIHTTGGTIFGLHYLPTGINLGVDFFFLRSGTNFKVNDIPGQVNNYSLSVQTIAGDSDSALYDYSFRFPDGVSSDQLLAPDSSGFIKKNMVGFQNQPLGSDPKARISPGSPHYITRYGEDRFRNFDTNDYLMSNYAEVSLPAGTSKPFYLYSNVSDDVSTMAYPVYPFYRLSLGVDPLGSDSSLFFSPAYVTNHNGDFALSGNYEELYDQNHKPLKIGSEYSVYRTDPSPANTITVGAAPLYTNSNWSNYANTNNSYLPSRDESALFQSWGGQSNEQNSIGYSDVVSNYSVVKDSQQVSSGTIMPNSGQNGRTVFKLPTDSTGLVPAGNYQFNLSRQAKVNSVSTSTSSQASFRVVDEATQKATPVDENPPALSDVHLLGDNFWQNVVDATRNNQLEFQVSPVPGLLSPMSEYNWMNPPAYNKMADGLTSVSLEQSVDDINFVPLTLNPSGDGYFNASIANNSSASLYTFRIKAQDLAGNISTDTFRIPAGNAVTVTGVDNVRPQASITSPANNQVVSGITPVNVTASDNNAVSRVELYADNTIVGTKMAAPYSFNLDTTKYNISTKLYAKAYDTAGNFISSSPVQVYTIDITAPTVTVTKPTSGQAFSGGLISVSVTANDNVGVTHVDLYGDSSLIGTSSTAPYNFYWNTSGYSLGSHALTAKAYDAAGNVSTTAVTVTLKDYTAPVISFTSPVSGQSVLGVVPVSINASDNVGVSYVTLYINGTSYMSDFSSPYTFNWNTAGLPAGNAILTAKAYDAAGNIGTTSVTVNVVIKDTTAPVISITSPANGSVVNPRQNVVITAFATDNIAVTKVEFYINGVLKSQSTLPPYLYTWTVPNPKKTTYTITVKATDAAGNIGQSSITVKTL